MDIHLWLIGTPHQTLGSLSLQQCGHCIFNGSHLKREKRKISHCCEHTFSTNTEDDNLTSDLDHLDQHSLPIATASIDLLACSPSLLRWTEEERKVDLSRLTDLWRRRNMTASSVHRLLMLRRSKSGLFSPQSCRLRGDKTLSFTSTPENTHTHRSTLEGKWNEMRRESKSKDESNPESLAGAKIKKRRLSVKEA